MEVRNDGELKNGESKNGDGPVIGTLKSRLGTIVNAEIHAVESGTGGVDQCLSIQQRSSGRAGPIFDGASAAGGITAGVGHTGDIFDGANFDPGGVCGRRMKNAMGFVTSMAKTTAKGASAGNSPAKGKL